MNKTIKFFRRSVYGKTHEYVAMREQSIAVEEISGRVTLNPRVKQGLERLGFEFEEVLESQSNVGRTEKQMAEQTK